MPVLLEKNMIKEALITQLKQVSEFFERSTSCLTEEDSAFTPTEGMFTVAQQVAHTAQTIDWFIEGMFSPTGFDLNFEEHIQAAMECSSYDKAQAMFAKAISNAIEVIDGKADGEMVVPLPQDTIMGGAPRLAVISAIAEHTAHHRGALTVYSRLLGRVPKMPYGEM
jgi:uncharacterized damage-inducible protein DinB